MSDINKIIKAIDEFLERKNQKTTTPVEINSYLEKQNLLNDSASRLGKPIREILRIGKIPHAYQIGVKWFIPHSGNNSQKPKPAADKKIIKANKLEKPTSIKGHKLIPIGELIVELLENKYKEKPICRYEYKPDWLLSYPQMSLIEKHPELCKLYKELTGNRFSLIEQFKQLSNKKLTQKQSFDMWIGEPFNFAVEFDEKQHFNQFRKITLDYYQKIKVKFPLHIYTELNNGIKIKPGKSGFTKLNSNDPLFPEILRGEKQDNRIRQRAFRDFLKDLLPNENGFNPTLRIPYQITNKSINDFSKTEVRNVENYIIEHGLI